MMASAASEVAQPGRARVYPRSVDGRFRRLKSAILVLAYTVYFGLPWLRWDRVVAADQAVLFDIDARNYYIFDLVIHVQDFFLLAGFLMIAAFLLFFVTGVAGRVFCGYFCFQTLWTDVFMWLERRIQGERPARMRLDRAPWSLSKVWKKGLTHLSWLAVAFATGFTFTLYWGNAPELAAGFFNGQAHSAMYATTLVLMATTYTMAGIAREQVCTYMCPYARFQSAMFDSDTLIIAYDRDRGEGPQGRAKVAKGLKTRAERQQAGVGDCIDCGYCVQVCPTGIDIRDGLQLQCISCGLCVDACDTIMDSMGWPRGLVRYSSENALAGKRTRYLKPKSVGYALVVAVLVGVCIAYAANRAPLELVVNQVRQPLSVTLSSGWIQNSYEVKVSNMTQQPVTVDLGIQGLPESRLALGDFQTLSLAPEQSLEVLAKVQVPPSEARPGQLSFSFTAEFVTAGAAADAESAAEPMGPRGTMVQRAAFYTP